LLQRVIEAKSASSYHISKINSIHIPLTFLLSPLSPSTLTKDMTVGMPNGGRERAGVRGRKHLFT
jgi:hypothetical protein